MKASKKDIFYVVAQFILFAAYLFEIPSLNLNFPNDADWINLILAGLGIIIIIVSMLQLNKNLSPFPSPPEKSELVVTGLFSYVRHPIYSGILMTIFFTAIYLNSGYKLIVFLLLAILFYYKSEFEELQLQKKFPGYKSYKVSIGRFFPRF